MSRTPYTICDVFTEEPYRGNQLAVFTDAVELSGALMQTLTREVNYSESTFVLPPESGGDARVRIFTPKRELPFAGHPTLGTAAVLGEARRLDTVRLEMGLGTVTVRLRRNQQGGIFGWMAQPLPEVVEVATPGALLAALGLEQSRTPIVAYRNGPCHGIVQAEDVSTLEGLRPRSDALVRASVATCVTVFALTEAGVRTRVFCPGEGIPEDPATGSAAGPVAIHLARHSLIPWGKEIIIDQGRELGRASKLFARAEGSGDSAAEVYIGGAVVIVADGAFRV